MKRTSGFILWLALATIIFFGQESLAQNSSFGLTPTGVTQTFSVSNSSSSITLNTTPGSTVLIQNTGSVTAFVKGGATSTTSDFPIQPGWGILMNYAPGQVLAAITASGSTTLLVSKGIGATTITSAGLGGSGGATIVAGTTSNASSGVATSSTNVPAVSYLYAWNGTTWDQVKSKPASTAAVATDTSLVVQLNPLSPGIIALGQTTKANSEPVVIASDQLGQAAAASSLPIVLPSDKIVGSPSGSVLGSYCMSQASGTMAAGLAANAPIISFRYGGANLALVRKAIFSASDTVAFVAGPLTFQTFAARSFSASDTGGTAATITGNNGKLRTSFATTGISDFRTSSTATLSAGTRTLDATPVGSLTISQPLVIGANYTPSYPLIQFIMGEQPLQLATNEGFVVQATVPGTGTWSFSALVCWDEVSAY